jgi:tetratricopeptide (TPR) repeat protein
VLSPNSTKSGWVEKEYSASLSREVREGEKIVLPLLIGNVADCDIPPLLSNKNYADFRRGYEAGLGALLRVLMPDGGFARPSTVEVPQLVFESELRREWDEIRAMLEMIEQLAPECKEQVNALREAKAEMEACVVEDNEYRFFYETAQWRKATDAIARFASSKYSDPDVAELAGKIGVRLASAFYYAGYRFYARDCWQEAQVLFDQVLALDPWHAEAAQIRETIAKILAKREEVLAACFAEAEEAAYRGCYEDVVRIIESIRSIDRCHRQSELDRLLVVARLRRGGTL